MIEWTMRFRHSEYARCQEIRHQSQGGTRSVCGLKMYAWRVLFAEEGEICGNLEVWRGDMVVIVLFACYERTQTGSVHEEEQRATRPAARSKAEFEMC
jgi:hypothetical protein